MSKVSFVINNAAFFESHRLPIALRAMDEGYEVVLIHGQAGSPEMEQAARMRLADLRIRMIEIPLKASSLSPLQELISVFYLVYNLMKEQPDIIHAASPKAVAYSSLAAVLCRTRKLILSISGFGYVFTDTSNKQGVKRTLAKLALGAFQFVTRLHPNCTVVAQNSRDYDALKFTYPRATLLLIPGSGVDLTLYESVLSIPKKDQVVLPARMLIDKGVLEFISAAKILKKEFPDWSFLLAGSADYDNPAAVSRDVLTELNMQNDARWIGFVEDMPRLLLETKVVCLPSHREGMPKVLLEAGAASCAIVTSDDPGCMEAIEPGISGLVHPIRDVDLLVDRLRALIMDPIAISAYGKKARLHMERKHSVEVVADRFLELYRR